MSFKISYNQSTILRASRQAPNLGALTLSMSNEADISNASLVKMDNNIVSRAAYPQLSSVTPVDPTNTIWYPTNIIGKFHVARFLNNNLVIGGEAGALLMSTDGQNFTSVVSGFGTAGIIYDMMYSPSLYIIVGNGGRVSTSTNLLTWTVRTSNFGASNVYGITFSGSVRVIVGADGKIASSTNGTGYTLRTSNLGTSDANGIVHNGTLFITGANDGKIVTSPDGVSWTVRTSSFGTSHIKRLVMAGSNAIAVGANGKIATSSDGINWTQRANPFGSNELISWVDNVDGLVYASSKNQIAFSSDNGLTWTEIGSVLGRKIVRGMAFGFSTPIAVGDFVATGEYYNSTTEIFLPKYSTDFGLFNTYTRVAL